MTLMSAEPADQLLIAFAQLNPIVGDIAGNADKARAARKLAAEQGADLILFTELFIAGYPPEDLVLKPAFQAACRAAVEQLAAETADGGPAMLIGLPWVDGGRLYNAVALLEEGRLATLRYKVDLPNYGPFDEKRVFVPGPMPGPIPFRGVRIGVPICEDIWSQDVIECLAETGSELLLIPNGSPYRRTVYDERMNVAVARVVESGLPLAYVNQAGGQDELVFDGASFVMNGDLTIAHQLPDWEEALAFTHWERRDGRWTCVPGDRHALDDRPADIYNAMVLGLRDYVNRNRFPGVVLGLSGGIDSALSAAVAVDALGADRVWCVMMPSRFTSRESLDDAVECARLLGVRYDSIPIEPAVGAFDAMLGPVFEGRQRDLAEENIQSRIRGVTLMALSNKFGHMLLTTGNKSEMSVGYATIYGDMAGGYSVLKDAYKTTVFDLSRWRNTARPSLGLGPSGPVMPDRVITKPPSAELRDNQRDDDSLPPYEVLDPILYGLVEEELSVDQLVARGFDRDTVARIERLLYVAEYKRRQSPPGVKLGSRNFGRDRRYPITNAFRTT